MSLPGGSTWVDRCYRAALSLAVGLCLSGFLLGVARSVGVGGGLPGLPQQPLAEARPLLQAGRPGSAAREYRQAIVLNADYDTLLFAGRGLAEAGDSSFAEASLRRARKLRPDRPEPVIELGWVWLRNGRLAEATGAFQLALRLHPCLPRALVGLGEAALDKGDLGAARESFEAALRCDAGDAQAHNSLGIVLALQGHAAEAVPHFEAALGAQSSAALLANLARARRAAALEVR